MKQILTFFAILFLFESLFSQENNDKQLWYYIGVTGNLTKKLNIVFDEETHYVDDFTTESFHHVRLGYNYRFNKYLALGYDNRMIFNYDTAWSKEFRPQFHATLFYKIQGFEFFNKSQVDYRIFTFKDDIWRYVNNFNIAYPIKIKEQIIKPYFAFMTFMKKFGNKEVLMNRFYIGFEKKIQQKFTFDLHYVNILYNGDIWKTYHVTGIKVFYNF